EVHRDDTFVVAQVEPQPAAEPDALDHAAPDPRLGHFFTLARRATAHKAHGAVSVASAKGGRRWMVRFGSESDWVRIPVLSNWRASSTIWRRLVSIRCGSP